MNHFNLPSHHPRRFITFPTKSTYNIDKMATSADANGSEQKQPTYEIPKECNAGVVVNEGPNYHVEVQKVPVPEPGECPRTPSSSKQ